MIVRRLFLRICFFGRSGKISNKYNLILHFLLMFVLWEETSDV